MRLFIICTGMLIVLTGTPVSGNPIIEHFMSELYFETLDWRLEIVGLENLDGYMLTTLSDTATFDQGINVEEYYVVEPGDLLQPLHIDPQGDILSMWDPELPQFPIDQIIFGSLPAAMIPAPPPGYSIALMSQIYYLDASPTLGSPNDTLNAVGDIRGVVTDSLGSPVSGVEVYYGADDDGYPLFVETDFAGEFHIHSIAAQRLLSFITDECPIEQMFVQVWPDSTVEIAVTLDCAMHTDQWPGATDYALSSSPNPARDGILFRYTLPFPGAHRVAVYDLRGGLVETLFDGYGTAGRHTLSWQPNASPAGVYVCRLTSRKVTISTRCILSP